MYSTDGNDINLHVVITNNCRHQEGEHTRHCRGLVRQELISKNTTLKLGRKIALDPDAVYNFNIGQNEDKDASLSSCQVAYNLSSESKEQTMQDRGLVKGAYSANFYKAAQEIMDEDLAIRQSIAVDGSSASEDHLVHGSRHLGIVRFAGYQAPEEGNRCTTPYHCVLHSARGVQIGHSACETRRAVFNLDETKLDVNHGLQIKKDDAVQLWQLLLTASFMQDCANSDDTNRLIRKNIPCKLLSEYHSPHTDAKTLAFDGTIPVTRLVYNNFMLYVIGHLESCQWNDNVTKDVLSFTLRMIPTLVSLCRSHVIRAVKDYISSTKRGVAFKDKKPFFKQLIVNLFRRMTYNMGISESIVHVVWYSSLY
eukprot:scaffold75760_cov60-Cyclotella_meneghiniana.AAC.4